MVVHIGATSAVLNSCMSVLHSLPLGFASTYSISVLVVSLTNYQLLHKLYNIVHVVTAVEPGV